MTAPAVCGIAPAATESVETVTGRGGSVQRRPGIGRKGRNGPLDAGRWAVALAALMLACGCCRADEVARAAADRAVYYVSPDGDDVNPRTPEAHWRTPEHAGELAQAGDTVLFLPGDYAGRLVPRNSGTAEAPIIFRAQQRRTARLIGAGDPGQARPRVLSSDMPVTTTGRLFDFETEDEMQVRRILGPGSVERTTERAFLGRYSAKIMLRVWTEGGLSGPTEPDRIMAGIVALSGLLWPGGQYVNPRREVLSC